MIILFLAAIVSILNIVIGLAIFGFRKRTVARCVFALIMVLMGFWGASLVAGSYSSDVSTIVYFAKAALISVLFIPSLFLLFTYFFPSQKVNSKWFNLVLLFLPPSLMLPFAFGEKNIRGLSAVSPSAGSSEVGDLYFYFVVYFCVFFSWAFIRLLKFWLVSEGVRKIQISYILFSFIFSAVIGIVNNGFIPLLVPEVAVSTTPLLPVVTSFIFTASTAYAVTRHRFLDINFRLVRSNLIFFTQLVIYFSFGAASVLVVNEVFHVPASIGTVISLLSFVLFLGATKISTSLEGEIKSRFSPAVMTGLHPVYPLEKLGSTKYFNKLANDIESIVVQIVPNSKTVLFVYLEPEKKWVTYAQGSIGAQKLPSDHILPAVIKRIDEILLRNEVELEEWKFMDRFFTQKNRLQLLSALEKLNIDIAFPLHWHENEVHGFIGIQRPKNQTGIIGIQTISELKKVVETASVWFTQVLSYHYAVRSAYKNAGITK